MAILKSVQLPLLLTTFLISTAAYADDYTCPPHKSQSVRAKFKEQYDLKNYDVAVKSLTSYIDKCTDEQYERINPVSLYYWLVSDLMLGHYRLGQFEKCTALGLATKYEWAWGEEIDKARKGKAMSAIKYNLKKCSEGISIANGASFSKKSCSLKGYNHAIEIPWQWGLPKQKGSCLYMDPGRILTLEEEIVLPETFDLRRVSPFLVLVTGDKNTNFNELKIPLTSGHLSTGNVCGAKDISLGGDNNKRLVLINDGLRYCRSGTAGFAIDAIYSLEDDFSTLLKHEVFIAIH